MRVAEHDLPDENLRELTEGPSHDRKTGPGLSAIALAAGLLLLAPMLAQSALADPGDGALPPLALTADTTSGDVVLSWQAPPGALDGYRVYRADDAEAVAEHGLDAFVAIGETTALSFVDVVGTGSGAESSDPNFRAIYFVTALLGDDESPPSNAASGQYPACWDVFAPTDCFIP